MTKYVAEIETEEYAIAVDRSGAVALNGASRDAQLESIDGQDLYSLLLDSKSYEVFVEERSGVYHVTVQGQRYTVRVVDEQRAQTTDQRIGMQQEQATLAAEPLAGPGRQAAAGAVTSPMTGVLLEIMVGEGDQVEAGQSVAILEAMKTENVIRAPQSGTVKNVQATPGQTLRMDDIIMHIDSAQA
jgi:biotin carboxyl carrier protein